MTPDQSPLPPEAQSPSINKKVIEMKEEVFDFFTALKRVAEGAKISRKEWDNVKIYGEMKEEKLMLYKEDGVNRAWFVSIGDITAEDWFVID